MERIRVTWLSIFFVIGHTSGEFLTNEHDMKIRPGGSGFFVLSLSEPLNANVNVSLDVQHSDLIRTDPSYLNLMMDQPNPMKWNITVMGLKPGYSTISANVTPYNVTDFSKAFLRVTIERSDTLYHVSAVVGWVYFLAWSISFYPQMYSNYKRKSVVGLNFDYLSLNLVGFIMYALFNCGLYWIPTIEQQYFSRNPKGLNPVQVNDIFFSLHAVFATIITVTQCFIYEVGEQRVSTTARIIHGIFASFVIIAAILGIVHTIAWLDFLYYCSYVKLAITLIKYVPQAYYNYKRKSTVGWSIGNIFLDFTGGILSMLQMILNAYNYDDWESIFGDPTKFGLGFFSVAFDIFFLIQHYVLYSMRLCISTLLKISQSPQCCARELNCWTAAITKKHRKIYERTYPTILVLPDGSSINVDYHEPRKIVTLPLDLNTLTEAERKNKIERRKPRTKVKLVEDVDDDFDENRYLKYSKR